MSRWRLAGSIVAIVNAAGDEVRRGWRGYAAVWGAASLVSIWSLPRDRELLDWVQRAGAGWEGWAALLSTVGRFENSTLVFAVVLAGAGILTKRDRWRDAAAACLLAGLFAGLAVNVLRPAIGRARPDAAVAPGFYGMQLAGDRHSLPSGHAASNAASAIGVLRVLPAVGVPLTAYALAVGWSRLQLNRHYPTDVMWGLVLGGSFGSAVGGAIAGRRRRAGSTSSGRS